MPHESGLTCDHMPEGEEGLCPDCQADYEEDAFAWIEFGPHPQGQARWQAEMTRMAEEHMEGMTFAPVAEDSDLPF